MVGTVNLRVAGQTGSIDRECRIGTTCHGLMAALNVTLLAEHRNSRIQQCNIIRPVRAVAGRAAFSRRGMFEQERPPFFGVALVTSLIDLSRAHHLFAD